MTPPPEQGDAEMRAAFERDYGSNGRPNLRRFGEIYITGAATTAWRNFQAGYRAGYQARDGKNEGGNNG